MGKRGNRDPYKASAEAIAGAARTDRTAGMMPELGMGYRLKQPSPYSDPAPVDAWARAKLNPEAIASVDFSAIETDSGARDCWIAVVAATVGGLIAHNGQAVSPEAVARIAVATADDAVIAYQDRTRAGAL